MIANINPLDVEKITITLTTKDGDHTFSGKATEGRSPFVTPTEDEEQPTTRTVSKNNDLIVLRKIEFKPGNFKIGDQIKLNQGYTATCQKVKKNGTGIFLLDQVLPYKSTYDSINYFLTHAFLSTDIFDPVVQIIDSFRSGPLRLPCEDELFGIEDVSGREQWELMKHGHDRVAHTLELYGGHAESYWVKNDKEHTFCGCLGAIGGDVGVITKNCERNIRPVFRLRLSI